MKRVILAIVLCCLSLGFISANLHIETSVDPISMSIEFDVLGEKLNINLESPGVVIDKYEDGRLKHITVPFINSLWEVYFHPFRGFGNQKEVISLIKRFRLVDNRYTLNDKVQHFDEEGRLISESEWLEGVLHGKQKAFDHLGYLLEEREYYHGFPVNAWRLYYEGEKLASEIIFPATIEEWKETEIPRIAHIREKNIYSMSYHHPKIVIQMWYDRYGFKIKEVDYEVYQDEHRYIIKASGHTKNFDDEGNIVAVKAFSKENETGTRRYMFKNLGVQEEEHSQYYDGELFKVSYIH